MITIIFLSMGLIISSYFSSNIEIINNAHQKKFPISIYLNTIFVLFLVSNAWILADKTASPYVFSIPISWWKTWDISFFLYTAMGLIIRLLFHLWFQWKIQIKEHETEFILN